MKAYGIYEISTDSVVLDLNGVQSVFPGAPKEVYSRPDGPIDILIGSSYRNLKPFGGEGSCKIGRLRLVQSHFGCGYILMGTQPEVPLYPVMSCNRAVVTLRIPEFFEAEELGVMPARSCKRCRGCKYHGRRRLWSNGWRIP